MPHKSKSSTPPRPRELADLATRDAIVDLLLERGYCCENQPLDFSDIKEMLGWAPDATQFKLTLVDPRRMTDRVLPAKRFKRWPCVFGFGEGPGLADGPWTIVDGLHRCAVANARGYSGVWAYVPVQPDGQLHTWETFETFRRHEYSRAHTTAV